ncbi:KpsF/GutQ family sugar-phosphate isomerase [Suttonella ornithocola]|uniref:Arabinose 5-phosphate isomerase n=1 Tax=Suttonella ornithocola TaxID=279832 RepID=A0A380MRU8_9GAMM|nr:KpsF/GutQ family sugar-phosphate isomerase [Suttonella ornithocola]SUO95369.1 Arabinose 5-phosphate isomerase KdsD [Suttonella ornithocola]
MMINPEDWLKAAQNVLEIESDAIRAQTATLNGDFIQACETILQTEGHLIITGMGKSGHIGAKIAATFASTGTPAFFVHPAEAGHGDLGMITAKDTLIALSYSGESAEIMTMISVIREMGIKIISLTARLHSQIAQASDIVLPLHIEKEACPLGLAPTSSSTATLALGDALAITVMQARNFKEQDFARSHPFGRLGRRLITKVKDVMRSGSELPINHAEDSIQTALFQITDKRLGLTLITDDQQKLLGIYTDGDLRRSLAADAQALEKTLNSAMTHSPKTITSQVLAAEALQLMQEKHITALPVVENGQLIGIVHIHDLLAAGVA